MITILTPTYNRAYTLQRLYESIERQTYRSFEWIVVDDGSTDNTYNLIEDVKNKAQFPLKYIRKENGGKHTAINIGVPIAQGEFIFIVDSDDYLPQNSIELIENYCNQIVDDDGFAGVSGNKIFENGQKVGGEVDYDTIDVDNVYFREKLRIKGDMAEVWRTSVLKEFPFPVYENERFMSEGSVWAQIARNYKLRYFNKPIYICDYLEDGLTLNAFKSFHNSPKGTMLVYSRIMKDNRYRLVSRIKGAVHYWQYTCDYKGNRSTEIRPAWWAYLFWPVGKLLNNKGVKELNDK